MLSFHNINLRVMEFTSQVRQNDIEGGRYAALIVNMSSWVMEFTTQVRQNDFEGVYNTALR